MADEYFDCGVQIINNTKFAYPLLIKKENIQIKGLDNGVKYQVLVDGVEYSNQSDVWDPCPFDRLDVLVKYPLPKQIRESTCFLASDDVFLFQGKLHEIYQRSSLLIRGNHDFDTITLENMDPKKKASIAFSFNLPGLDGFPSRRTGSSGSTFNNSSGIAYDCVPHVKHKLVGPK